MFLILGVFFSMFYSASAEIMCQMNEKCSDRTRIQNPLRSHAPQVFLDWCDFDKNSMILPKIEN